MKNNFYFRLLIHFIIAISYQVFISVKFIYTDQYHPFGGVFQFAIWAFWHAVGTLLYCIVRKLLDKKFALTKELLYQFSAYFIVLVLNFAIGNLADPWLEHLWHEKHPNR